MCNNFDEDTLLIISADHGHKDIEKAYTLLDYPEIQECLIMPAYLESRVLTFWVKENMREAFVERFNSVFENEFWLMTREEFLDKYHFLGYGEKHPKIDDFIGNYMALSTAGSMIRLETFLAEGKPVKKSTHCGLTKEEILDKAFTAKEISEEEFYLSLVAGPTSFMTLGSNPTTENRCYNEEKEMAYNCFKNNNIVCYPGQH